MTATATVSAHWDMASIAARAGSPAIAQFDPTENGMGVLIVRGVSQAALDAAIAAYDHEAAMSAQASARLRTERDARLKASDPMMVRDRPLSDARRALWAAYRQQLRDLPANTEDPANPVWPTPPA